jgi:hypothetical protein
MIFLHNLLPYLGLKYLIHALYLVSFDLRITTTKTQVKQTELTKITFCHPNLFLDVCDSTVVGFVNSKKTGAFVGGCQFFCWVTITLFLIETKNSVT